jgi:hypothetical protein
MHFKNLVSPLALPLFVGAFSSPLFAQDLLPIDRGRYVQSSHACDDLKGTMLFIYDGASAKSNKTTCTFSNVTSSGNIYQFNESCSYYHRAWSILPTTVTEYKTTMDIRNRQEFLLKRENESLDFNEQYRWCASE